MIDVDTIKSLHDHGLHSNVSYLSGLLLSSHDYANIDKNDTGSYLKKFELLTYYANGLFEDEQYRRAEVYFNKALKLWKYVSKVKIRSSSSKATTPDVDVRFKLHQCYIKNNDVKSAVDALEGVPLRQRTPKINMALGKLYQMHGMERSATTCYKEVLRVCPLAIEAAINLLHLGVPLNEVSMLMNAMNQAATLSSSESLQLLLKSHSFLATGKYPKASQCLKNLETQHYPGNSTILSDLSNSYSISGNTSQAIENFERLHTLEPHYLKGMDTYAGLLTKSSSVSKLEKLAQSLIATSQIKSEPWTAIALYCSLTNKKMKAVYFAQKAHMIDTRNIGALLTKASLLSMLNKEDEATLHFKEAIRVEPNNFDAYSGLVDCYMAVEKHREALSVARNCHKTLGASPRTLTLCARVLAEDPDSQDKAQSMAEKAMGSDASFLPAVYVLTEILIKGRKFEAAISLLKTNLENQRTSQLHYFLGICYKETNKLLDAVQQFIKACRLDVNNTKAAEALDEIEQQPGVSYVSSELDLNGDQSDGAFNGDNNELDFDSDYEIDVSWLQ